MPKLTIDNREVQVAAGSTILAAAGRLGIEIPTMCFLPGGEPAVSCGLCVVKLASRDGLVFACAEPAADAMVVLTDTDEVREARTAALELLLGDHLGDCVAPCRLACRADLEIPRIIRRIAAGDLDAADEMPAAGDPSTCLDCSAPCENACRRRFADGAVAIRLLMRYAAVRADLASENREKCEKPPRPFSVHIGRPLGGEMERFLAEGSDDARVSPAGEGFSQDEARREATRCLHCDCRKADACKLRIFAERYGAKPARFRTSRRMFEQDVSHPEVIYEPGKCIVCGICVRLAERSGEKLAMTFIGRGFDVRVRAPFGAGAAEGLRHVARKCAEACPTGALAMRES